ncbi:hypothetical protein HYH03_007037 [Edaphochlamys debaryana]|uniref:Uncharacterized protein n=1 Tax=Edaphochlamys debaryana TaxID=47281 RepID=A0A835YC42_9CHLO|nr:hypothetical protein HYH03_007037 [Edaphochlamys debaryana]|eukprot:KAG2494794.1 hypothetical protein HYH03_007037 [Edaphochlamys debaryana]
MPWPSQEHRKRRLVVAELLEESRGRRGNEDACERRDREKATPESKATCETFNVKNEAAGHKEVQATVLLAGRVLSRPQLQALAHLRRCAPTATALSARGRRSGVGFILAAVSGAGGGGGGLPNTAAPHSGSTPAGPSRPRGTGWSKRLPWPQSVTAPAPIDNEDPEEECPGGEDQAGTGWGPFAWQKPTGVLKAPSLVRSKRAPATPALDLNTRVPEVCAALESLWGQLRGPPQRWEHRCAAHRDAAERAAAYLEAAGRRRSAAGDPLPFTMATAALTRVDEVAKADAARLACVVSQLGLGTEAALWEHCLGLDAAELTQQVEALRPGLLQASASWEALTMLARAEEVGGRLQSAYSNVLRAAVCGLMLLAHIHSAALEPWGGEGQGPEPLACAGVALLRIFLEAQARLELPASEAQWEWLASPPPSLLHFVLCHGPIIAKPGEDAPPPQRYSCRHVHRVILELRSSAAHAVKVAELVSAMASQPPAGVEPPGGPLGSAARGGPLGLATGGAAASARPSAVASGDALEQLADEITALREAFAILLKRAKRSGPEPPSGAGFCGSSTPPITGLGPPTPPLEPREAGLGAGLRRTDAQVSAAASPRLDLDPDSGFSAKLAQLQELLVDNGALPSPRWDERRCCLYDTLWIPFSAGRAGAAQPCRSTSGTAADRSCPGSNSRSRSRSSSGSGSSGGGADDAAEPWTAELPWLAWLDRHGLAEGSAGSAEALAPHLQSTLELAERKAQEMLKVMSASPKGFSQALGLLVQHARRSTDRRCGEARDLRAEQIAMRPLLKTAIALLVEGLVPVDCLAEMADVLWPGLADEHPRTWGRLLRGPALAAGDLRAAEAARLALLGLSSLPLFATQAQYLDLALLAVVGWEVQHQALEARRAAASSRPHPRAASPTPEAGAQGSGAAKAWEQPADRGYLLFVCATTLGGLRTLTPRGGWTCAAAALDGTDLLPGAKPEPGPTRELEPEPEADADAEAGQAWGGHGQACSGGPACGTPRCRGQPHPAAQHGPPPQLQHAVPQQPSVGARSLAHYALTFRHAPVNLLLALHDCVLSAADVSNHRASSSNRSPAAAQADLLLQSTALHVAALALDSLEERALEGMRRTCGNGRAPDAAVPPAPAPAPVPVPSVRSPAPVPRNGLVVGTAAGPGHDAAARGCAWPGEGGRVESRQAATAQQPASRPSNGAGRGCAPAALAPRAAASQAGPRAAAGAGQAVATGRALDAPPCFGPASSETELLLALRAVALCSPALRAQQLPRPRAAPSPQSLAVEGPAHTALALALLCHLSLLEPEKGEYVNALVFAPVLGPAPVPSAATGPAGDREAARVVLRDLQVGCLPLAEGAHKDRFRWAEMRKLVPIATARSASAKQRQGHLAVLREALLDRDLKAAWIQGVGVEGIQAALLAAAEMRQEMLLLGRDCCVVSCSTKYDRADGLYQEARKEASAQTHAKAKRGASAVGGGGADRVRDAHDSACTCTAAAVLPSKALPDHLQLLTAVLVSERDTHELVKRAANGLPESELAALYGGCGPEILQRMSKLLFILDEPGQPLRDGLNLQLRVMECAPGRPGELVFPPHRDRAVVSTFGKGKKPNGSKR